VFFPLSPGLFFVGVGGGGLEFLFLVCEM
jgi:hypothetical protein